MSDRLGSESRAMQGRGEGRSVALLTVEGPASRVLANVLSSAGLLGLIVIESPRRRSWPGRRFLRYLAGLMGVRPAISLRMPPEQRIESESLAEAQRRVAEGYPVSYSDWPTGVRRVQVDDLNGERCRSVLRGQRPDAIAVFRTKILKKSVFELARLGAVNCHYSLLPEYRGTFVEFWQRMNNDLQTAGVTFHFVDEGVDRGDIIASLAHDSLPEDITPFELRYRNYLLMLEHFPGVLEAVLDERCDRRQQPAHTGRAYRSRDITNERRRELYGRLGLLGSRRAAGVR